MILGLAGATAGGLGGCASGAPMLKWQDSRGAEIAPSNDAPAAAAVEPAAPLDALDQALELAARLDYRAAAARLAGLEDRLASAGRPLRAAEASFWLGFCYEKLDRPDDAVAQYRRLIDRYPDSSAARQARERLGLLPGR